MEHGAAVRRAAGAVHGVDLTGAEVEVAGRTDKAIARDLLRAAGVADAAIDARAGEVTAAIVETYAPPDLSHTVAPGVPETLTALAAEPETYRLALVTGNLEPVAHRKLAAAGIGHFFARGQGASARTRRSAASCPRSPAPAPAAGRASAPS